MKTIHHHLCRKSRVYHHWHQRPYHQHHHWLVAFLALLIGAYTIAGAWQVTLKENDLLISELTAQAQTVCNVGPATGNDTAQIQSALDDCAGGEVRLRSGQTYTAGTIEVRSGTTFNLNNATLVASGNSSDFKGRFFVTATIRGSSNVKIIGPGTIKKTENSAGGDISPLQVNNADGLEIRNITIDTTTAKAKFPEAVGMHLRINDSQNVLIEDIVVRGSRASGGNDGIAIGSTKNAVVRRCDVDTHDDGLWARGASDNVLFEDCVVSSDRSGLLVGSSLADDGGNFSNITFRNITIRDSASAYNAAGILFKFRDAGVVENITFENITIGPNVVRWINSQEFNRCDLGDCKPPDKANQFDSVVRNFCFDNITVASGGGNGSKIIDDGDTRVENLQFFNVEFQGGSKPLVAFKDVNGLTIANLKGANSETDFAYDNVQNRTVVSDSRTCGGTSTPTPKTCTTATCTTSANCLGICSVDQTYCIDVANDNCPVSPTPGTPVCPNGTCESSLGETPQSCPQDCVSDGWTFCANENGFCPLSGTKEVRYGANGLYRYLTLTNGTQCSNAVFGDPINGVVKQCYYRDTTTPPPICGQNGCEPGETATSCPQDCGSTQNQPPRNLVLRYLGPTPTGGNLCGNGAINTGEQCDGKNLNGQTCQSLGFSGGTPACYPAGSANQCTFNTSGCTSGPQCTPACGTWSDSANQCGTRSCTRSDCSTYTDTRSCTPLDPRQGHTFPRFAAFNFWCEPLEHCAKFDLVLDRHSNPNDIARARQLNPNVIWLHMQDVNTFASRNELPDKYLPVWPEEWAVVDSKGNKLSHSGWYSDDTIPDLSDLGVRVNGQRFIDFMPELLARIAADSGVDGIASDGLYYRGHYDWYGWEDVDFDRNGVNDMVEHGKAWAVDHWGDGVDFMLTKLRQLLGDDKFIVINTGSGDIATPPAMNGPFLEYHGINSTSGGTNYFRDNFARVYQPPIFIPSLRGDDPGRDPAAPPRSYENFPFLRWGLAYSMLHGIYFQPEAFEAGEHTWTEEMDEIELDVGYPKGSAAEIAPGVWARIFDTGAVIGNFNDHPVTVTDAQLRAAPGYAGGYRRFEGCQDPAMNNGEQFTSVELKGHSYIGYGDSVQIVGDGIVLVTQPTRACPTIMRPPGGYWRDNR